MTWSNTSSHVISNPAATICQKNQTTTVVTLKEVDVSRVFAYVMSEKGARSFITFTCWFPINFLVAAIGS